ncbi:DUF6668 family protein [Streptodolium elevatio]|uniref:DUF6668 family protein n=1 Tax=Streptodolium elevatio TaxID=3157996 RepID=A0ABV3D9Q9_9ACTN
MQTEPNETNPWVPEAPRVERRAAVDTRPSYLRLGPSQPGRGRVPPPVSGGLPLWTPRHGPVGGWWWVACHGGAGTTTLALAAGGSDAERRGWPNAERPPRVPAVLVARTHARGLTAAQEAAQQWASGAVPGVELLGLVAIADAPGKLPKVLRDALRFVAGGVPRVWQVPWVEEWRTGTPPPRGPAVTATVRLAADLGRLVARQREYP